MSNRTNLFSTSMPVEDSCTIFVHLAKTGGMSLNKVLEKVYPCSSRLSFHAKNLQEELDQFRLQPALAHLHLKLVYGHGTAGLHNYIPKRCHYITMLRDPVDRVISHYAYIKSTPDKPRPVAWRLNEIYDKKLTLADAVQNRFFSIFENAQTLSLSGLTKEEFQRDPDKALALAKQAIDEYFAVGLTEEFGLSVCLFAKRLGWQSVPVLERSNQTADKKKFGGSIDANTIDVIQNFNRMDTQLYKHAKRRFEHDVSESSDELFDSLAEYNRRRKIAQIKWKAQSLYGRALRHLRVKNWRR